MAAVVVQDDVAAVRLEMGDRIIAGYMYLSGHTLKDTACGRSCQGQVRAEKLHIRYSKEAVSDHVR